MVPIMFEPMFTLFLRLLYISTYPDDGEPYTYRLIIIIIMIIIIIPRLPTYLPYYYPIYPTYRVLITGVKILYT